MTRLPPEPGPATPGPPRRPGAAADPRQQRLFDDEVADATRYERGLAVKCVLCLVLVAVVVTLRMLFLG